jgi:acyl-coenzyme A synthetase/AMP-(fatty) acid ligase
VVSASSFTITPQTELPEGARSVPIGKAFPGRRLYVLDEDRRPVELGETGELYVGGTQLARGYLNDAELTAERFVPDPFAGGGGRMYKTGDLVRLHPDGNLEFVGRNDDQIKLRGYRVELGEIAAALRSLDDVRDAAVVVLDETPARLGAGVVVQAGRATSADALTAALRAKLPAYMVPSVVEILPSLPVSPGSRKVDPAALRRLLAAPVGS